MYYNEILFCIDIIHLLFVPYIYFIRTRDLVVLEEALMAESFELDPWSDLSADFSADRLKPLPLPKIKLWEGEKYELPQFFEY
jgi:hypothetical protein